MRLAPRQSVVVTVDLVGNVAYYVRNVAINVALWIEPRFVVDVVVRKGVIEPCP